MGQLAAGLGVAALGRRSPGPARDWGPTAALAGVLVLATARAWTPGPGALAVPGLVLAVGCNMSRRICERNARRQTAMPAGNRVARSGRCRCRRAPGRSSDR